MSIDAKVLHVYTDFITYARIEKLKKKKKVSQKFIVNQAVREYLERELDGVPDVQLPSNDLSIEEQSIVPDSEDNS